MLMATTQKDTGNCKKIIWRVAAISFIAVISLTVLEYNWLTVKGQYSDRSYVEVATSYFQDFIPIVLIWILFSAIPVAFLIYYKNRKPLLYLNCFLAMLALAANAFIADGFNVLPNGPPSTYVAIDCGRHVADSSAWPASVPKEGFACAATKQAYGWPFVVNTVYTNVKDGFTNAPLTNFEIPGRQNINRHYFNRLNMYALLGGQMIWFILFLLITSLPLAAVQAYNVWRKRHEGITTLIVAIGAIIASLLVGLVGLYVT